MKRQSGTFRIYVRDGEGAILAWTDTLTTDPRSAENAILDLQGRTYLLDSPCVLVATYESSVYYLHEFDTDANGGNGTRELLARLGRLDWLSSPVLH
ncbi:MULTISPECIES: hypothetical protein [unclassified Massilia]|uniref:hypothetical protein n=1 Tax=unclassified Massilia TaxID=2609279 RepID=UPI001B83EB35|nr:MULTISPECIES: hypothetical protein [unclassified Massilia]MBQ5942114.1 hypothetical protein [Massilia sp. AB1]MBQ5965657.1 hypothetical protein [Massilia sp. ZL223]